MRRRRGRGKGEKKKRGRKGEEEGEGGKDRRRKERRRGRSRKRRNGVGREGGGKSDFVSIEQGFEVRISFLKRYSQSLRWAGDYAGPEFLTEPRDTDTDLGAHPQFRVRPIDVRARPRSALAGGGSDEGVGRRAGGRGRGARWEAGWSWGGMCEPVAHSAEAQCAISAKSTGAGRARSPVEASSIRARDTEDLRAFPTDAMAT